MSQCKSCNAPIIWMKTAHGKQHPVNFEAWIKPSIMTFDTKTMVSHFATCPQAAAHRKPKTTRENK